MAVSGALASCSQGTSSEPESSTDAETTTLTSLVRLSSVVTPQDGGLYDDLLPDFERQTGYQVEVTMGEDVYGPARNGQADVVLSHYGHEDAQTFVQDGLGQWPQTVFFNQHTLLGPPSDPARVQGLTDLVEAFRRIAQTRSPFVVNNTEGIKYLTDVLWEAAGSPAKGDGIATRGCKGRTPLPRLRSSAGTFSGG
jgi:tungstate transport system substrate-binding protein